MRVHPFTDGNGRATRLLADLVFIAAQKAKTPLRYAWDLDKRQYITLLQQYDRHRDPRPLAEFIGVRALGEQIPTALHKEQSDRIAECLRESPPTPACRPNALCHNRPDRSRPTRENP